MFALTPGASILVTGGAGYIGSHVSKALAEAGANPICLDTLEKGHRWAVRWGALEQGDVGDREFVDEVFRRHKPRVVVHLAGYIDVGESVAHPHRYFCNNTLKSQVLIDAALRNQVEAFVFSSTCAVYGLPRSDSMTEDHEVSPISPYAASKARVELALNEAAARGLRSASLRYFNATGADPAAEIGEAHDPETHLLPLAIDAALRLRGGLIVHGSDYETADGSCVRDYVHVTDLAAGHLLAVEWLLKQDACQGCHHKFNLGSGVGYTVNQVIRSVERIIGRPVPHACGARRAGDAPRLVGSVAKAARELTWFPVCDLDSQIADAVRWRRSMPR